MEHDPPKLDLELSLVSQDNPLKDKPEHWKFLLAATFIGCIAFSGLSLLHQGKSSINIPADPVISQKGDSVGPDEKALIDGHFMTYTAKLLPLDLTDKKIKAEFMRSPLYPDDEKSSLLEDVESGKRDLTAVVLWDNFDQDGDVVSIESAGVILEVPLYHAPVTVFLPYVPGVPLLVHGVHDGGGGITAAIETSSGAIPLPVMAVGQTISLPVL
ncbi:MAG: hypothetical protein KDI61_00800 [Alphaproteobacteria bacterium]|nr:hypothetical protein [Alphaproteobacteria bacterium]